ncbi:MAG: alpha/beta hydrolase [Parvibaculum sp.]|nr:alpha/beta hydrolase [Parvibaculum sp.]
MSNTTRSGRLTRADGHEIAYATDIPRVPAGPTGLFWLSGFKSDMAGTKVQALAGWAREAGRALTRFDYFGHGQSTGAFLDGTIGRWIEDAVAVFDEVTVGPQVLVGSSMGAWVALHLALARPERVKALVLIAPAPDFTEALMWAGFSDAVKATLLRDGVYREAGSLDEGAGHEGLEISLKLIEEGRRHLLLGAPIAIECPVRILQGMRDESVPYTHALRLAEALVSQDVRVMLTKAGDHRLSTDDDLARLMRAVGAVLKEAE